MANTYSFFFIITFFFHLFGSTLGNTEIINFKATHSNNRSKSCQLKVQEALSQTLLLQPYPIDSEKGISESATIVALQACGLKENAWYQLRASWPAVYPSDIDLAWNDTHCLLHLYASFYSANTSLMKNPRPVPVQIDLDPLILGFLPSSVIPTVIVITALVVSSIPFAFFILKKQKQD
ncbi:GPI-mannosyltransferase II complex subunit Pga1 [Schizosaccharomyces osmophilus]|uniref:GPI-mannosyltransferase II complex subunit Pga1 n=1 Tax=Schizosaccharomyces osmophilus TaxID=2545709 RepID=A0AAE9WAD4_9SCHI|nr:GPI-mannosyltransferase II complex subunit Pga1 [Schizosaccharomyces osmophilus]WBW72641.1 GPI-mannosyltransferase II complex subunit Pga1 [Schizosaccharomyces osmophilus]